MLAESPLRVDVGELVRRPGATKQLDFDAHVPHLKVAMGHVVGDGEVHADLLMEALVEGILVSGTVTGEYELECSRCLATFREPFTVHVSEVYAYPEQPEIEEGFVVSDDTIDLVPMLRDEILLSVPSNPLHDPSCRGLCAECGQDLNAGDCGHAHDPIDLRWEPLRELKDRLGQ